MVMMDAPKLLFVHALPVGRSQRQRELQESKIRSHAARVAHKNRKMILVDEEETLGNNQHEAKVRQSGTKVANKRLSNNRNKTPQSSQDVLTKASSSSHKLDTSSTSILMPSASDGQFGLSVSYLGASALDPFQTEKVSSISPKIFNIGFRYSGFRFLTRSSHSDLIPPDLSIHWPQLMPGSSYHATVQDWSLLISSNPAVQTSMLFGSFSHQIIRLRTQGYGKFSADDMEMMEICAAESIRNVNKAIQDVSQAMSDATILSVLCLASHSKYRDVKSRSTPFQAPLRSMQCLDIYGSHFPDLVHMAGLARIIFLRGFENIELPGLRMAISRYVINVLL
jgi:hypothetical protein